MSYLYNPIWSNFWSRKRYKVKQKKIIILLSGKFVTFFRHIFSVHLRNIEIKRSKNDAQEIDAFELKWTLSRWSDSILGKSLISSLAFIPLSQMAIKVLYMYISNRWDTNTGIFTNNKLHPRLPMLRYFCGAEYIWLRALEYLNSWQTRIWIMWSILRKC